MLFYLHWHLWRRGSFEISFKNSGKTKSWLGTHSKAEQDCFVGFLCNSSCPVHEPFVPVQTLHFWYCISLNSWYCIFLCPVDVKLHNIKTFWILVSVTENIQFLQQHPLISFTNVLSLRRLSLPKKIPSLVQGQPQLVEQCNHQL